MSVTTQNQQLAEGETPNPLATTTINAPVRYDLKDLKGIVTALDTAGRSEEVTIVRVRELLRTAANIINGQPDLNDETVVRATEQIMHNYLDAMKLSKDLDWQKSMHAEQARTGRYPQSDERTSNALQHEFLSRLKVWGKPEYLEILKSAVIDRWTAAGEDKTTLTMELNNMCMMMDLSDIAVFLPHALRSLPDYGSQQQLVWGALAYDRNLSGMALGAKNSGDATLSTLVRAYCELPANYYQAVEVSDETAARNHSALKGNSIVRTLQAVCLNLPLNKLPKAAKQQVHEVLTTLVENMPESQTWVIFRAVAILASKPLMTQALTTLVQQGTRGQVKNVAEWAHKPPSKSLLAPLIDTAAIERHLRTEKRSLENWKRLKKGAPETFSKGD